MRHNLEQADTVLTYQEGEVHISGSGVLDGVQQILPISGLKTACL